MRRVVKIGGSLLVRKDLPIAIRRWLASQTPAENLVIVGGGDLIEAVRRLDALRPSDPTAVHWRCIKLLDATYETAQEWFADWQCVESPDDFCRGIEIGFSQSDPTLVKVSSFYQPSDRTALPLDWRTTTDAIAVWLGNVSDADEVVLLKSCEVDPELDVEQLAKLGVIDEAVPLIKQTIASFRVQKLPLA